MERDVEGPGRAVTFYQENGACPIQFPVSGPTRFMKRPGPLLARVIVSLPAPAGIIVVAVAWIFNPQGVTVLPAFVTDRIAPGGESIKAGAWFTPDANGIDTQGCANALTLDRPAPSGATTYNTWYVDVALSGCKSGGAAA